MASAHRTRWSLLWCAFACLVGVQDVAAQMGTSTYPIQGLAFGTLQPGEPGAITTANASRRAAFGLEGIGSFNIVFTLPMELVSASGASLPVSFGPADGYVVLGIDMLDGETFDPNQPHTVMIPSGVGQAEIYLGGRAEPGSTQVPGDYLATITLQVTPIL